jgi:sugar phosphate isomerase/epimerase
MMNLMICMRGEPEQLVFLPEIAALGAGIELGSYGLAGIRSEQAWATRFALHQAVRTQFSGPLAIHGPFLGMEYAHPDHLIRDAVERRLDMTFDVAVKLRAGRVILHSGYKPEHDLFRLQEIWLQTTVEFWRQEMPRWADAHIEIALENDTERLPDLLVQLANKVDNPSLGLCLDVGHQSVFSKLQVHEWIQQMGDRLLHIHLHDNDGTGDYHWALGRGTIDFEAIYATLKRYAPDVTLSLEVEDAMDIKMENLRKLAAQFVQ